MKVPAKWSVWPDVEEAGEKVKRNVQSELSCWIDRDMVVMYVRVGEFGSRYHLVLVEVV